MTALLLGLLIVAAGAGGTWLALFRVNPARATSPVDSRPAPATVIAETPPSERRGSTDVRIGAIRRIRSTILLLALVFAVAASIAALASAILVLAVAILA